LNRSIALRTDSPHAFYLRAKSSLAMSEYAEAIVDLEYVVAKDPKFDYHRATGLLGDAYARTGDLEKAGGVFRLPLRIRQLLKRCITTRTI
jgi:tetratricopeptide (TPR) repeat protein